MILQAPQVIVGGGEGGLEGSFCGRAFCEHRRGVGLRFESSHKSVFRSATTRRLNAPRSEIVRARFPSALFHNAQCVCVCNECIEMWNYAVIYPLDELTISPFGVHKSSFFLGCIK